MTNESTEKRIMHLVSVPQDLITNFLELEPVKVWLQNKFRKVLEMFYVIITVVYGHGWWIPS